VELKDSTVDLLIYFWVVQVQYEWINTRSDLIFAIDRLFKENNIEMPDPES
jgi:small-conductance mechanosensitive channel